MSAEIHYKWWKNPRIREEMELTDKQVETIDEVFSSYRERIILFRGSSRGGGRAAERP
jgi:hypothetical protein